MTGWLATILIFLPLSGAVLVWLFPVGRVAGPIALLFALAEIGFWITALGQMNFDSKSRTPNFDQQWTWFSDLGVSYHVGFYGFSIWLAGLAVVVMAAAIAYGFWVGRDRPSAYFGLMLFLTSATVGVFASQDLLLFYVFFEAMMIPLYLLIGVWGGPGRLGATVKFVIYTMTGSLLMLASVLVLALAATGLVYGSLLAFRAPDVRGVIAYSSLAQMGLITIGIFSVSTAGISGAVLQSVNHGLISASLFLLAGTIERRTSTGSFERLGGMARGRPALATMLMVTGIIALAVPGSSAFAGEFLILLGVFGTGWGWAVAGATGIVLAAMYMLRLISAVLHKDPGPAVPDSALDLRPAEIGIVVPLVACLLALSAWPAAISGRVVDENTPLFGTTTSSGLVSSRPNDQPPESRMNFV